MLKDIQFSNSFAVGVAIARSDQEEFSAHILNDTDFILEKVFVSTSGFGNLDGREVKTTELRYYFEEVLPGVPVKIENLDPDLFRISNEYLISFFVEGRLHDKKIVFEPEHHAQENFQRLDSLDSQAITLF